VPIYKTIRVSKAIKVYIWKVTEPEEELAKNVILTNHCQERMAKMKSEMHRRAFLSIRHLLKLASYEDKDLIYNKQGKPHLKDGKHISITHSHNFTAIIISSTNEVGIDIEMHRDKILKIASKFTSVEEYDTIVNSEALIKKLTVVWGVKESLYKIYAQPGLSFLNHINVPNFSLEDKQITAEILYMGKKSSYNVTFLEIENFACIYALKL